MEIKNILSKQVSRKEFMVLLGIFILSLTGIRQLLDHSKKAISGLDLTDPPKGSFGVGPYGM